MNSKDICSIGTNNKSVITIGNFDGVHLGHKKLLLELIDSAKKLNAKSSIITFKSHPREILSDKQIALIYDNKTKYKLLKQFGVDNIIEIDFNKNIAKLSPKNFFNEYININKNILKIICGDNFRFGKQRIGDSKMLANICQQVDIDFQSIDISTENGKHISSTEIRRLIKAGKFVKSSKLLGRKWQISGVVEKGNNLGRQIGFPTANLNLNYLLPLDFGVFACYIEFDSKLYPAVMNYGKKPSINNYSPINLEVHIFNFSNDIYGKQINVYPINIIRQEKTFDSIELLKTAINEDIKQIKQNWSRLFNNQQILNQ